MKTPVSFSILSAFLLLSAITGTVLLLINHVQQSSSGEAPANGWLQTLRASPRASLGPGKNHDDTERIRPFNDPPKETDQKQDRSLTGTIFEIIAFEDDEVMEDFEEDDEDPVIESVFNFTGSGVTTPPEKVFNFTAGAGVTEDDREDDLPQNDNATIPVTVDGSSSPTSEVSLAPTSAPTSEETLEATSEATTNATASPIPEAPSPTPSPLPSPRPSPRPTLDPTSAPTSASTSNSSLAPTSEPTSEPTSAPSSLAPTIEPFGPVTFVGNDINFFAPYPLGVCQGDCDTDDDCQDGLYCYQRTPFSDVPGCTNGEDFDGTTDFCVYNETSGYPRPDVPIVYDDFGEIEYVGNDGTWYAVYPLGPCQGDCDFDSDCAEGLYCHQRSSTQFVPGCTGARDDMTTGDFCTWNTTFPRPPPKPEMPPDAFRLKLYWQEGYLWQNETFEREWCVYHDYDGYPGTGLCWYARDQRNCSSTQLYTGLCLDYDPRAWFTFIEVGSTYTGDDDIPEVLIQTVGDNPRCMTRRQSSIYLESPCDPDDATQRFFALQGSFTGVRFELAQYTGYTHENCVTNAHHPKSGEVLEFHICEEARKLHDETSFWELQYD